MNTELKLDDLCDKPFPWDKSSMLEVLLEERDDFLKIKETLSRIGVASKREHNTLYQSCHILHKQGKYYIVHFKELFALDKKCVSLTYDDIYRRNTIAMLLSDWGLLSLPPDNSNTTFAHNNMSSLTHIKIISHANKKNWRLCSKYSIGVAKA